MALLYPFPARLPLMRGRSVLTGGGGAAALLSVTTGGLDSAPDCTDIPKAFSEAP